MYTFIHIYIYTYIHIYIYKYIHIHIYGGDTIGGGCRPPAGTIYMYIYINDGIPLSYYIMCALHDIATPQICLRIAAKSGGFWTAVHAQARAAFLVLPRVHPFAMLRCLSRPQRQGEQTAVPCRVDGGWECAGPSAFLRLSFLQVSVACTSCTLHSSLRPRSGTSRIIWPTRPESKYI